MAAKASINVQCQLHIKSMLYKKNNNYKQILSLEKMS